MHEIDRRAHICLETLGCNTIFIGNVDIYIDTGTMGGIRSFISSNPGTVGVGAVHIPQSVFLPLGPLLQRLP